MAVLTRRSESSRDRERERERGRVEIDEELSRAMVSLSGFIMN